MIINSALKKLANYFPVPLYVVGGAVRDYILGYKNADCDLASQLTSDEVKALLKGTEFHVADASQKLGTLKIYFENESYEYTVFRVDSYADNGNHSPESVKFVKEIALDASRRDFTINAIYYDIKTGEYVDPTGGMEDLKKGVIRATREPEKVLQEDALRILRMIRFSASYGYEIDKATYDVAVRLIDSLKGIAKERLHDEFEKIIRADTVHGVKDGHVRGLRLLMETGAMRYLIPELYDGVGFPQRADFHKYDVYGHIEKVYEVIAPHLRLVALFHDVTKPSQKLLTGRMAGHDKTGAVLARKRMNDLRYSNKEIARTCALVEHHMYDFDCVASISKVRRFVQKHHEILDDLCALKFADSIGAGVFDSPNPSAIRILETYKQMREEGVPFSIKELKIDGNFLIETGVPNDMRGALMKELLELTATDKNLLTKEAQEAFVKRRVAKI